MIELFSNFECNDVEKWYVSGDKGAMFRHPEGTWDHFCIVDQLPGHALCRMSSSSNPCGPYI